MARKGVTRKANKQGHKPEDDRKKDKKIYMLKYRKLKREKK